MTDTALVWLVVWGTVVGVDLIAGPQVMIARPFVAAIVAGMIVGDVVTGTAIGIVLELFAWEILPFGAARYPDYGVAAVVATGTAAYAPGVFGLGLAVGVGLITAQLGDLSMHVVRSLNTSDLDRNIELLDAGEYKVARNIHLRGFVREVFRGLALVSIGLLIGGAIRDYMTFSVQSVVAATLIASGVSIGSGFTSGLRAAGSSRAKLLWYAGGVGLGVIWIVLR